MADTLPTSGGFLVCGAGGAIGAAVVRGLRELGLDVMAAVRTIVSDTAATELWEPKPDSASSSNVSNTLGRLQQCQVSATDSGSIQAAVAATVNAYGRLSGAVNCIGSLLLKPAHSTTDEEWAETIAVNLTSAFYVTRAAAKAMSSNGGGSIVLLSSAAARTGLANHEAIAAAKAGVEGLMLSAAASYGHRGVRVNCVAPGLVRSEMTRRLWDNDVGMASSTAMHILGRIGVADDVAAAIVWLLHPGQTWVTGQTLGIDGGLANIRPRMSVKL